MAHIDVSKIWLWIKSGGIPLHHCTLIGGALWHPAPHDVDILLTRPAWDHFLSLHPMHTVRNWYDPRFGAHTVFTTFMKMPALRPVLNVVHDTLVEDSDDFWRFLQTVDVSCHQAMLYASGTVVLGPRWTDPKLTKPRVLNFGRPESTLKRYTRLCQRYHWIPDQDDMRLLREGMRVFKRGGYAELYNDPRFGEHYTRCPPILPPAIT